MKNRIFKLIFSIAFATLLTGTVFAQQTADDYFKLGNEQFQKKNYFEAARYYGECIRVAPKSTGCYLNRGIARSIAIGYGLAVEDFNMVISLDPINAKAFRLRGQALEGMKNFDAAFADYNQAIRLKPDYAEAYNSRAYYYSQKGDADLAIADYTQSVKFNPNDHYAFNSRGQLYQKKGMTGEALADFNRAVQIKPDYAPALYNRGKIYREQGKTDLSDADFARAAQLDPLYDTLVKSIKTREETKKTLDNLNKALDDAKAAKMASMTPTEQEAYKLRESGASKLFNKKYDEAIIDLTKSVELNPKDGQTLLYRGEAFHKKGDFEKAIADFSKAVIVWEKHKDLRFAFYRRAETHIAKGDHNSALTDANRSLALDPKADYGYYLRGKAYVLAGKKDLAIADFKKTLELYPNSKIAKEELAKLGAQP